MSELPLKPPIICISETKPKGISYVNISLPGYSFIHENSSTNAGGVGIYILNNSCFEKKLPDNESL